MAKRSSTKKALKSLFSRSEANLDESAEKDAEKTEAGKKKFKFLKFKTKSRKGSDSEASVLSAVETNNDGEDGAETIKPKTKGSHLYATAPRSKSKEFSYSELDLRKPRRFATFSFGLKKKKRKDGESLSKSTFGLHDPGLEEKEETPLDLRRMELDEAKTKFSMSQPELDTDYKFDIPSPPPVATNQSESPFTFPRQAQPSAPVNTSNSSTVFVVHKEPKAPIASIPELQLDGEELIPVLDNPTTGDSGSSGPVSCAETTRDVTQTGLLAALSPVCTTTSAVDDDIPQEICSEADELQTVALSHRPADNTTQSGETFLPSVESELYATISASPPIQHKDEPALDADSAGLSLPRVPEPASISSTVSRVKSQAVDHDAVYGELYDSLFPQGFISTEVSTLSNSDVRSEMGHLITSEPVVIKAFYESHTESNVPVARLSTSHESSGFIGDAASFRSTSQLSSTYSDTPRESDIQRRPLPSQAVSPDLHYSELSGSHSEAKSGGFSLIQDTVTSVPVQNSAPPVSHYVTSQGADAQVTDSKRRVILVKELVTDEASSDPGCPSTEQDKMSAVKGLEPPSGLVDGYEGLLSPAYLSVGSDDGSAVEIYYSAEEDNLEESRDEDMFTMDEREGSCMVDGVKEVQEGEMEGQADKPYEGGVRVIIVKTQSEGGNVGQQLGRQSGEAELQFPVSNDGPSQQKAAATTALPQTRGEEEVPAAPVEQVDTPMVCNVAPPATEPHGQGEGSEGNRSQSLETEAHLKGEETVPGQEQQCLSYEDAGEAASSDSRLLRQAEEEQASGPTHRRREASPGHTETESDTNAADPPPGAEVAPGSVTHSAPEPERHRTPRSEGADTITQSINRSGTVHEQVAVELSASNADVHHPGSGTEEVLSERHKLPAEAQPDLDQGSRAADSVCASDSPPPNAVQESDDTMSTGYSSLSTTLSIKTRPVPKEDESKHRIHKVSLIGEAESTSGSQEAVDGAQTSTAVSNGAVDSPEYKWKNKFDGVSQFKPSKQEDSSFSTYSPTSPLSVLSEASTYDYPRKTFSSSYFSFSTSSEEPNIPGSCTETYLTRESEPAEQPKDERRRSLVEQEESPAPAGEGEGEAESEEKSRRDSPQLPSSQAGISKEDYNDSTPFTGVFKATLVDLIPEPPAPPSSPPESPDTDPFSQFDMDILVDTLKSMGPAQIPRGTIPRAAPPTLLSSLPPIVEDAPAAVSTDVPDSGISPTKPAPTSPPAEPVSERYALPPDLGLKRNTGRDTRSPMELMKQNLQDHQLSRSRGLTLPLKTSTTGSILMGKSSDVATEEVKSPVLNGNPFVPSSRLDNSLIFRSYRSSSIDLPQENGKTPRTLFHTYSLPELGPANDRMSAAPKEPSADAPGPRFDRLSVLMNSSSATGSSTGAEDAGSHMSPLHRTTPPLAIGSPPSSSSPTCLLSPTGSIDLHRPFTGTNAPLSMFGQTPGMGMGIGAGTSGAAILQRSFSSECAAGLQQTPLFNRGSQFQRQEPEPDQNLTLKYRAFPDAYLTKQKEHGKLNPRPGKMYIFDQPGMCGQRLEIRGDVIDATSWELQETISVRVVRGGWVLYEKPNFKGEKIALDEGDMELTSPFLPHEEHMEDEPTDGEQPNGEAKEEPTKPARRFIIGSLRRAVRDYSVPEIGLFPEENAEGKKVVFRDTSEDARIFGFPVKANSIIINAGLWLVYAQPFFQGVPRVLEVGGYPNPAAWGAEQPYVASVHPLKIGEPRVENMNEPKIVIYEKSYFTGKSRTITTNMRDFMTRTDRQQNVFMYNVGSLKVLGGIWVGYEREGFRGHQYLLEEGEFHDWRVWGGHNAELRSVRVIRADLADPLMVMIEQPEDELDMQEEKSFEVTDAIPDVEPFGYKTFTRSIHVVSGAWVAYSHVDFSGNQYILEKGIYSNYADWGSEDNRICSVQPILLALGDSSSIRNEVILYSEPEFQGNCHVFDDNQAAVPEKLLTKSCRVAGGSWVLYENEDYSGNQYVLSEGDYPSLASMGCAPGCTIRSMKIIPLTLSVPSISLFGLECLEGREITADTDITSLAEEGYNNHVLSVKVSSGCWVICEHSNYRGRQFLLEPIEITNWPKFSSLQSIGSLYPVRQKRHFFRIKNKERGHFMSVQGGVEELRSGRVVVTPEVEPMSDVWFYHDGLIKNKLAPNMCLQVMGNVEPGSKMVLWSETRQPIQTWTAQMTGLITSLTFPGFVVDVKGGKTYDKDHVVVMPENEEQPSQQWEIELL